MEKIGILASTSEVINLTLENGKHHTNYELEAFIRKCRLLLPEQWKLTRVRIDCGGFDVDNLTYLDENDLEFVIKCKKYAGLWTIIQATNIVLILGTELSLKRITEREEMRMRIV